MKRGAPTWKQLWRELRAGSPGTRFSDHHRRRGQIHGVRVRMAFMIAGVILLATGVLMFFTPGPGVVLLALGAAVLARESATAARALDRLELRVRAFMARMRRWST